LPCVIRTMCNVNMVIFFLCLKGVYLHIVPMESHLPCFEIS
jgi:hypothetical protein